MDDVFIYSDNISKKFCRNLKRSLWYGMKDLGSELTGRINNDKRLRKEEFWALTDISFRLKKGESLGLIGPNGAGKTTLLRLLNGLINPDKGKITVRGNVGCLIELGAGFNPILTGRENIYARAAVLGMSKKKVAQIFDEIVDFSGISEFIDTPVQSYSSGMRVRLGYSVAAHLKPDILLVDEVLAVGDMAFKRKCLKHMLSYLKNGGVLIFVSHNMHLVQSLCKKCLFINKGKVEFNGDVTEGINQYFETQQKIIQGESATGSVNEGSDDNPVIIKGIEVLPVDGAEIYTGNSVRLVLNYCSKRDLDNIGWVFSIWTGDQWVRITTGATKYAGIIYRIKKGKGKFSCIIPNLNLTPGTYAVKASIQDLTTRLPITTFGYDNAPSYFNVIGLGREIDNRHAADEDIIDFNVNWEE